MTDLKEEKGKTKSAGVKYQLNIIRNELSFEEVFSVNNAEGRQERGPGGT